jgi:hypothetical protein
MRLTRKQVKELEVVRWFIPTNGTFMDITNDDIERYFAWSDRGVGSEELHREALHTNTGLSALYWGKQRRDLQITSYLEDWGRTCTAVDFMDEPVAIVEHLAKAMGKPAILTFWKMHNQPQELNDADREVLEPLEQFSLAGV